MIAKYDKLYQNRCIRQQDIAFVNLPPEPAEPAEPDVARVEPVLLYKRYISYYYHHLLLAIISYCQLQLATISYY